MTEKKKHKLLHKLVKIIVIFVLITILISVYGFNFATKGLKVKEYKIESKNIPNEFYGLKIIHISDIHYGKYYNKKEFERVVLKINEINPDIVVITGDIMDDKITDKEQKELNELLKNINCNIKKYIITGDHDQNKLFNNIIKNTDFFDISDSYDIIYSKNNQIFIAGISSNISNTKKISEKEKDINLYLENNKPAFKIMLMHEPDYVNTLSNKYDLILAGHSHNGQFRLPIIGAIFKPKGATKYYDEFYNTNKGNIYISSGLGTTGLHIRFLNKPSINFYRIVKK